jgi:hypothetical protein
MSRKSKRGRPPLPRGRLRHSRLFCRLLGSEVGEIETAARKSKKTKSEWIRAVLLAAARAKSA